MLPSQDSNIKKLVWWLVVGCVIAFCSVAAFLGIPPMVRDIIAEIRSVGI